MSRQNTFTPINARASLPSRINGRKCCNCKLELNYSSTNNSDYYCLIGEQYVHVDCFQRKPRENSNDGICKSCFSRNLDESNSDTPVAVPSSDDILGTGKGDDEIEEITIIQKIIEDEVEFVKESETFDTSSASDGIKFLELLESTVKGEDIYNKLVNRLPVVNAQLGKKYRISYKFTK